MSRKVKASKFIGNDEEKMVSEFNYVMGVDELDSPGFPDKDTINLRLKLLREEVDELQEAIENSNITEVLDAFVDIQYILSGTISIFGMKDIFRKAFDIIHENNLSKVCVEMEDAIKSVKIYKEQGINAHVESPNGFFIIKRSDGKVLKPISYKKPNLKALLR